MTELFHYISHKVFFPINISTFEFIKLGNIRVNPGKTISHLLGRTRLVHDPPIRKFRIHF